LVSSGHNPFRIGWIASGRMPSHLGFANSTRQIGGLQECPQPIPDDGGMPMYITASAALQPCAPSLSLCHTPPRRATTADVATPISLLDALTSPPTSQSKLLKSESFKHGAAQHSDIEGNPVKIMNLSPHLPSTLVGAPPGLPVPPGIPSPGAVVNGIQVSQPCARLWQLSGCEVGQDCDDCRFFPEGDLRRHRELQQHQVGSGGVSLESQEAATYRLDKAVPCTASACANSEHGSTVGPPSEDDSPQCIDDGEQDDKHGEWVAGFEAADGHATNMMHVAAAARPRDFGAEFARHNAGLCEPCAWFWRPSGCHRGDNCKFCHICPDGTLKARKKVKQAMLRQARDLTRSLPVGFSSQDGF